MKTKASFGSINVNVAAKTEGGDQGTGGEKSVKATVVANQVKETKLVKVEYTSTNIDTIEKIECTPADGQALAEGTKIKTVLGTDNNGKTGSLYLLKEAGVTDKDITCKALLNAGGDALATFKIATKDIQLIDAITVTKVSAKPTETDANLENGSLTLNKQATSNPEVILKGQVNADALAYHDIAAPKEIKFKDVKFHATEAIKMNGTDTNTALTATYNKEAAVGSDAVTSCANQNVCHAKIVYDKAKDIVDGISFVFKTTQDSNLKVDTISTVNVKKTAN